MPSLAQQPMVPNQLSLFDFSERYTSNTAAVIVPGHGWAPGGRRRLLVTRVGDALQEPFWPEGLGINRGFLHVLDCADLVQGYASLVHTHGRHVLPGGEKGSDAAIAREDAANALLQRREELFGLVKRVSGTNRLKELKPTRDARQKPVLYGVDPASRYVHMPRNLPPAAY